MNHCSIEIQEILRDLNEADDTEVYHIKDDGAGTAFVSNIL